MPQPSRREHLIDTAIALFCEHGFHATGIDRLLEEAGVSKKTMYQHFRSKEELIYAALQQFDSVSRNDFMKNVERSGTTPKARLLAIFDVMAAWFDSNAFYGCVFINAIGEYSETESPIRDICKQFKRRQWSFIADLARQAGATDPESLADEITLLMEGCIVTAQVSQKPEAAETARKLARIAIDNALRDAAAA